MLLAMWNGLKIDKWDGQLAINKKFIFRIESSVLK